MTSTRESSHEIEILPEHIIDQIKAGEVLERPASLLKELLENSLDAGSTEIHIHLIENGMDLLSIEDNGHGMTFKNLPFAFLRHATSKLRTFEDLYRLHSFGFRGEALASVAASSRLTCTTQPKDLNVDGGKIIISGGATELLINQRSSSHGTSIFIKDLFFNTPARLKFIKSKVSEKSALKKMIYSFVLSNPQVTFTIKWDEKEKEIFKATKNDDEGRQERVSQVFFSKRSDAPAIMMAQETYDNYTVKVYFTKETYTTPQYRHHYLFANKRFFQDKSLHAAVLRNLDALWRFGESGHYMVEIDTPLEEVDVNVHPNKTQIKFLRSDVVYSLLVTSIKKAMKLIADSNPAPALEMGGSMAAQSLFSRDENQSFDLMSFANTQENSSHDESASFSLFNRESAITAAAKFQRLFDRYIIADLDKTYLIDLKKLLVLHLTNELKIFSLSDESSGPLLISEPFKMLKGKIDQEFESLKNLGFEFDRLNAEYIVLRTIPKFLPQSLLTGVADTLVKYFSEPKVREFEAASFQKYFEAHFPMNLLLEVPEAFVEKIIPHFKNSESMVELTENRLQSLFK